ncbi:MAG TPA: alpha/beta hydrolase [Pirellulaceae bacterium]|jgi:pimeloyl-ACP methyl ester carboxylesterase|nr:alpha/beta hydrolase [Pirellulaceae bacterium]
MRHLFDFTTHVEAIRRLFKMDWRNSQRPDTYRRARPLILINGLAEQSESWYRNRDVWQQKFDVHLPGVLVYDGPVMQERLRQGGGITVDFLTNRLSEYLDSFVQSPPYHLVGSSLGGQIAVEYTSRYPDKVDRLVLLCPSGMGSEERLPITEGARHKNYQGLVESTFCDRSMASPGIIKYYEAKFASKAWRRALFETVRGTKSHSVRDKLHLIARPTLVICGGEDRIVDSKVVRQAVDGLANFRYELLPQCGHAPQLERPQVVNRLVAEFLQGDNSPVSHDRVAAVDAGA